MQLKFLKLAGFKSFVDPTIIPFESQLVAVVGPNGCGKSNIIDAVRWVMGESSAKNLRGESMIDVIFNGSSTRKSIGQASVELIFDNSLGRLAGQYANYQEVSVKRLVTRDGDSFYYLNGSRCRRRDITDIFLGTGAGARGYSIIGQDTISRLIEARPEDLRAYLEEAAGVSKYKERRRETVQRIQQTRENLARVADIRDELDKQLLRLERQAKAAERYTLLKQEARVCKAEIFALKWRDVKKEQVRVKRELSQFLLQYELHRTNISRMLKENTQLRENLHDAQENFQEIQARFYQLSTEIARLEENNQQLQREQQRLLTDKQNIESEIHQINQQLALDSQALLTNEQTLIAQQTRIQVLQEQRGQRQKMVDDNKPQKNNCDLQWETVQTVLNQAQREAQVEQVRLKHAEQRCQQTQVSLEKNQIELSQIVAEPSKIELLSLQEHHKQLIKQHNGNAEQHQKAMRESEDLREQLSTIEKQLHQTQDKVQALSTEYASVLAAQNTALQKVTHALPQWDKNPRLAEVMTVPDKWLRACELVLGQSLQAIVLDTMEIFWPLVSTLDGSAVFIQPALRQTPEASYPRLSDKISGVLPCWSNALDDIFAAESLSEALSWLPSLNHQQSVVTADGYWLGQGWARFDAFKEPEESSVLLRQQTLGKLNEALLDAKKQLHALQTSRDQLHVLLVENEQQNKSHQQVLLQDQEALRNSDADINNKHQALERIVARKMALNDENLELIHLLEELAAQKYQSEQNLQCFLNAINQHEQELQHLRSMKVNLDEVLQTSQKDLDETKEMLHREELLCTRETLRVQQLRDSILREQRQVNILCERLVIIEKRLNEIAPLFQEQTLSLQEKIAIHHQFEDQIAIQRQKSDDLQKQFQDNELFSQQEERQANTMQEKIQQEQLQEQGLMIRAENLMESLGDLGVDAEALLAQIPTEMTLSMREQALLDFDEKIQRLGAINLVAIEEYHTELQRKQHLDEQYRDLIEALSTLDVAIAKMDKETQLRLKNMFDQVNVAFQALFPRLFEGGHARLELTCDNLLEAGILVMAQPPGKRNGTIHSLSGGEKAMTAVALVFAIFQQNPSPFCMLDEVDAPLDDINVKRFCGLVKEMSEFVQFLFITHNKVTMELADHLIGVTMREPGVSRVVSVNVDEVIAQGNG